MRRRIPAAIQAGDAEALRALLKEDPAAYALRTEQGHSFLLLALHYGRRDLADACEDAFELPTQRDVARAVAVPLARAVDGPVEAPVSAQAITVKRV
jgi:ankyrin repeat protein